MSERRIARRPDLTAGYLVSALLDVVGHKHDAITSITISPTEVVVEGALLYGHDREYGPSCGSSFRTTHPIAWAGADVHGAADQPTPCPDCDDGHVFVSNVSPYPDCMPCETCDGTGQQPCPECGREMAVASDDDGEQRRWCVAGCTTEQPLSVSEDRHE